MDLSCSKPQSTFNYAMLQPLEISDVNGDDFFDDDENSTNEKDLGRSNDEDRINLLSNDTSASTDEGQYPLHHARSLIYVFHTLNQFSEISWQFALILLWAAIVDYKSLFFVSSYGVCVQLSLCFLSPWMGTKIDMAAANSSNRNRLDLVRMLIVGEAFMIFIATACAVILVDSVNDKSLADEDQQPSLLPISLSDPRQMVAMVCIVLIHITGSLAQVLDKACLTALERDWIVVMSSSAVLPDASVWLSETNVKMTQIDLGCQIIAPGFTGLLLEYVFQTSSSSASFDHWKYATISLACWNCASLCFEWRCLWHVYKYLPILQATEASKDIIHEQHDSENNSSSEEPVPSSCFAVVDPCLTIVQLRIYFGQRSVAWGGLGLAMLYCNALTFSGMMTAYLVSCGMPMDRIGILRGISSAMGLMGTITYDLSIRRFSLLFTGLWSIFFEFLCLTLTFASIFFGGRLSLALMIGGVLPSRIGKSVMSRRFCVG
jgi:solute carrier family 40 (iron-regulated transporter), member 1